jgi:hypothetical protein
MYNLQFSLVPTNQHPFPLMVFVDPQAVFMQQLLLESQANTMPWCEGFYGLPITGPVYHQGSLVPTNQHPFPLMVFVDPVTVYIQQLLLESQANTMPWCEGGFYGLPITGPVNYHQGIAPQDQNQYPSRASSSGPSRNRNGRGFRKAEPPYPNQSKHAPSGRIGEDRSTGTNPRHARIGASNNTGVGKVWRTPSKNPFMIDRNLI